MFRSVSRKRLAALAVGLAVALPAGAAGAAGQKPACYTADEFEAEQAIRLHTELMVIGLTCQSMDVPGKPSLFARYRQFTDTHQNLIRGWEKTMVGHFKRTQKGNSTRGFDTFRTRLANETSQRAIALSTPVFCATHAPQVDRFMTMTADDLLREVKGTGGLRVAAIPRCDLPQVAASGATPAGGSAAPRP